MSMNVATPRDLIVAGLVSVVGQGVAVVAPHVEPALESAKAAIARSIEQMPNGTERTADPGIGWAKRCVAAYRKSMEVAPELSGSADGPMDKGLPEECVTPIGANHGLAVPPNEQGDGRADNLAERSTPAHGMWDGQLDYSTGSDAARAANGRRCADSDTTIGLCDGGTGAPAVARRDDQRKGGNAFEDVRLAIAPSELDNMRGGFEMDGGLKLSFGIERAVYINGQLVTTQTLNSSDLRGGAAGQAAASLAAAQTLSVIQNGAGNTFVPGSVATTGTVIQNTLNGQTIENRTVINANVNSMQALRSLNVQTAVRDGVIGSLRR